MIAQRSLTKWEIRPPPKIGVILPEPPKTDPLGRIQSSSEFRRNARQPISAGSKPPISGNAVWGYQSPSAFVTTSTHEQADMTVCTTVPHNQRLEAAAGCL